MDDLDTALIGLLQTDARQSIATLARKLRVARTTVQSRLERLETKGVIAGYTVKLGDGAAKPLIHASVLMSIEPRSQAAILQRLRVMPDIERVFTTSGRFDLLLQVAAQSTAVLDGVLDMVAGLPGVKGSESLIHLTTRIDRGR